MAFAAAAKAECAPGISDEPSRLDLKVEQEDQQQAVLNAQINRADGRGTPEGRELAEKASAGLQAKHGARKPRLQQVFDTASIRVRS